MERSKVLVVGATGYIGRRMVDASLAQGHQTYILRRPEIGFDIDKLQVILSFAKKGAIVLEGSFSDHKSLVEAVKRVDVVICAMSGVHFRSHNLLLQLKLVEAIKEAPNVKRFFPSEFGMDPARMGRAMEPGNVTFLEKMEVRKAIENAEIPHTYVSANCFAAYFVGSLSQFETLIPPTQHVNIYGDGNTKGVFVDEGDVATYTIKAVDDPRTLNKTLYIRPPENILSQSQLVEMWEQLTHENLLKHHILAQDFLDSMKDKDYAGQVAVGHFYHIFYEGCLTNFKIEDGSEEASQLYPEVNYTRMHEFLKTYLLLKSNKCLNLMTGTSFVNIYA